MECLSMTLEKLHTRHHLGKANTDPFTLELLRVSFFQDRVRRIRNDGTELWTATAICERRRQPLFGGRRAAAERSAMCAAVRIVPQPPRSRYCLKFHCVERLRFSCERRRAAPQLFLLHQKENAESFSFSVILDVLYLS